MEGKLFFFRFIFVGHGNDKFFPIQILIFSSNPDVRRCSYFELGLPVEPGYAVHGVF